MNFLQLLVLDVEVEHTLHHGWQGYEFKPVLVVLIFPISHSCYYNGTTQRMNSHTNIGSFFLFKKGFWLHGRFYRWVIAVMALLEFYALTQVSIYRNQ